MIMASGVGLPRPRREIRIGRVARIGDNAVKMIRVVGTVIVTIRSAEMCVVGH